MNLIDPQNLWNAALAHPQSSARMSLQLPRADGTAPAETNDGALDENGSIALEAAPSNGTSRCSPIARLHGAEDRSGDVVHFVKSSA
jgi:hypothetical protein